MSPQYLCARVVKTVSLLLARVLFVFMDARSVARRCGGVLAKVTRKKPIDDSVLDTKLSRCLTTCDLTLLGVGGMVGSGIYILAGVAAKELAGPGITISFLLAGICTFLSALCYAEFAARVPKTGSAYMYTYVSLGELLAFLMGWASFIANMFSAPLSARTWSGYLDSLFDHSISNFTQTHIVHWTVGPPIAEYPDFIACAIMLLLTVVASLGAKSSSTVNGIFTIINILILSFVFITGLIYADGSNWFSPETNGFLPFGFKGVLSGSAACFFAFSGFDIVSYSVEEAKNPSKSILRATVLSFMIVVVLYFGTACSITLLASYKDIKVEAPLPSAFAARGLTWARYIVTIGPLCGLTTVLLAALYSTVRIGYAMASDGLLFSIFAKVSPVTNVPIAATMMVGAFMSAIAFCFDVRELLDFLIIFSLLQYTAVAACVIILRFKEPEKREGRHIPAAILASSHLKYKVSDNSLQEMYEGSNNDDDSFSGSNETIELQEMASGRTSPSFTKASSPYHSRCTWWSKCLTCRPYNVVLAAVVAMPILMMMFVALLIYSVDAVAASEWWAVIGLLFLSSAIFLLVTVIMAYKQYRPNLPFEMPCVPILPTLSIFGNMVLLVAKANRRSWCGATIVIIIGLAVYFGYGIRHSKLGQHAGRQHRATQEEDRLIQAEDADDEESQFSER